jgi:hypothetical protein
MPKIGGNKLSNVINSSKSIQNEQTNVNLKIDQTHLMQINQLMNDLQSSTNLNNCPSNTGVQESQQQPVQIDTLMHQQQTSVIISPNSFMKLDQQIQFQNQPQQNPQMLLSNNQIAANSNQVQTIMLNGQPALFIPASAPISSNLLTQMLQMNANSNQSQKQNSIDYSSLNSNNINSNINSQATETLGANEIIQAKMEPIEHDTVNQNQQSNEPLNTGSHFLNLTNLINNQDQHLQQNHISQAMFNGMPMTDLASMNGSNMALIDPNNQNQHMIPIQNQQQQQIIYIQPDGTMAFPNMQQPLQQQVMQASSSSSAHIPNLPNVNGYHPIQPKPTGEDSRSIVTQFIENFSNKVKVSKRALKVQDVDFKSNKVSTVTFIIYCL